MMQQSSTIAIFCCYARKDKVLLDELKTHLSPLQRRNIINVWYDGNIIPGAEWGLEIKRHLNEAKIILLLISADFINSDYCYGTEMQHASERHKQREARVIPVILRPVGGWEKVPFGEINLGQLQALPKDAKPVISGTDHDEGWKEVVEGIEGAINMLPMRESVPSVKPQLRISWRAALAGIITNTSGTKTPFLLLLLVFALVILVIISSIVGVGLYQNHVNQVKVSATAQAIDAATAQVIAKNPDPYPPHGMLALYDPLSDNSRGYRWGQQPDPIRVYGDGCDFIEGAYHIKRTTPNYLSWCVAAATDFSNFTFEVQMTIIKGGTGGILFRADDPNGKWYELEISESGQCTFVRFDHIGAPAKTLEIGSASAFKTGLNQSNLVAVVVNRSAFDFYVNHQKIMSVSDDTYSHGTIGILADNAPSEVVYSNAKVWAL